MDPVLVHKVQGSVFKNYLLLTRQGAGLTNLANLRDADLLVLEGKGGDLSHAWLDSLLLAQHLGAKETFFHSLQPVFKPTAAVLPVFFGSKPACLVDRQAFELMSELNPQVGRTLLVLAVSEPYLESVTCVSKSGWSSERARQDLIQTMLDFNLEPNGRQILELFKVDQMVPFRAEYLESVQRLKTPAATPVQPNLAALPADKPEAKHVP
jgi:phosphonate transport system substrate-binding protein